MAKKMKFVQGNKMKQKGILAKKLVLVAVLAVGLILGSFYLTSRGVINLGREDDGRTLEVGVGTVVVIELQENPSTGYEWQYTLNGNFAEVMENNYISGLSWWDSAVGVGGTRMLKLKIIGSGELIMGYGRPWENQPDDYFSVTFKIK